MINTFVVMVIHSAQKELTHPGDRSPPHSNYLSLSKWSACPLLVSFPLAYHACEAQRSQSRAINCVFLAWRVVQRCASETMRLHEKESDGEKGMEELEKENLHLDKALAVIWSEIHCLHDDIDLMMDLIQNVKEHVKHLMSVCQRSHAFSLPILLVFKRLCLGKPFWGVTFLRA